MASAESLPSSTSLSMSPQQACYDARWQDIKSILQRHHVSARAAPLTVAPKESAHAKTPVVSSASHAVSDGQSVEGEEQHVSGERKAASVHSEGQSVAQAHPKIIRPSSIVSMLSNTTTMAPHGEVEGTEKPAAATAKRVPVLSTEPAPAPIQSQLYDERSDFERLVTALMQTI